ncbi:mammalian cell entry protein [Mycobacterium sp. PS03-16]|uniref:mammalian cell entry protein n=1 Tax=Mycobacterium sp. PS03-16 TaxID=2559611 RepID=UPI0010730092|nr:mammalian cell entry protein [Mycobacterium sp. PS03-16]TFV57643.1 mammalian cell entry protein [Mycobacterium sp. PS03-16]
MEDQPADSGDLTTPATAPSEPARRGWRLPWRRAKAAAPEPEAVVESEAESPAGEPVRRMPTGKARRAGKTEVTTDASEEPASRENAVAEEPVADEPVGEKPVGGEPVGEEPVAASDSDADVDDAEAAAAADPDSDTEVEPEPEPILVPHRPAGRRLLTVAAAASVLFVAAGAFAGAMVQPYLSDRAAVDTKLEIARTAADAITTLWSYTPDDMAALPDRSSRYLSGEFASEYRRYIDAIVSTNQQAQVTNTTQVMGTAVESLSPSEATAIVYTNSVSMSPVTKNVPSLRYLSYRLTLERDGGDWLITGMNSITSLDLTPQV